MNRRAKAISSPEDKLSDVLHNIFSQYERDIGKNPSPEDRILDIEDFFEDFTEQWIYKDNNEYDINYENFSGPLFLLMHKNISVTNCGCEEIISLISMHSRCEENVAVSFFSNNQYKIFFGELFKSAYWSIAKNSIDIFNNRDLINKFIKVICETYGKLLTSTIIVNFQFTSVSVHMPQTVHMNVCKIVSESGYIHSGGFLIYTRKTSEAMINTFEHHLSDFLDKHITRRIFLSVYADEFFSPYDNDTPVSLRNGLAEVKIQLRKQYIGESPLLEYLTQVLATSEKFKDKIYLPSGAGNFRTERDDFLTGQDVEDKSSLWLIVDHGITSYISDNKHISTKSNITHLCLYEQAVINENQFLIFKERKPGWYASITLPHTLSSALVNIARCNARKAAKKNTKKVFLDPFYGTGTTLIDFSLRADDCVVIGFDRSTLAHGVTRDNIDFFSKDDPEHHKMIEIINSVLTTITSKGEYKNIAAAAKKQNETLDISFFYWAFKLIDRLIFQSGDYHKNILGLLNNGFDEDESVVHELTQKTLTHRVFFYLLWRALALGRHSIRENKDNAIKLMEKELKIFLNELKYISESRSESSESNRCHSSGFIEKIGLYSRTTNVNREKLKSLLDSLQYLSSAEFEAKVKENDLSQWPSGIYLVKVNDSIEVLKAVEKQIDILITDPPYGFNATEGGGEALLNFFSRLPERLLASIKSGGQLTVVLPAFSKTGKQIPYHETSEYFVRKILSSGKDSKRRIISPAVTRPMPGELFKLPYYWVSPSTLERRIVSFTLEEIR